MLSPIKSLLRVGATLLKIRVDPPGIDYRRCVRSWAHLSYGVRSTPGDATSAETGLVLMRWRGAGDVAASRGLADGQAIAAKHRQGDAAKHLASERCMGRGGDENYR
jgi:hypothetical protein